MLQLGLPMLGTTHASAEALARVGRRQLVLRRVAVNLSLFRADFLAWIEKNLSLWECFEAEANQVWSEGRKHYGSRTIWEVMRHHTRHRDAEGEFKINNNFAPDVARLYLLMYPERDGFFDLRGRGSQ